MNFRPIFRTSIALAFAIIGSNVLAQQSPSSTVTLSVGMYQLKAEVAKTAAAREIGLMNRRYLEPNSGMLFDFERPAEKVCMWMKNTLIPLSVAFVGNDGVIINVEEMEPNTLDNHCNTPGSAVRYALEMDKGWFEQRHIGPGAKIANQ